MLPGVHDRVSPEASEVRAMLKLAFPIVLVQVGMMAMGVVDTVMVGRVSPASLAAVALGNLYFFAPAVFGMGILAALDPIVSQAVGADDAAAIGRGIQRGLVIACGLTVPVSLLLLPGERLLTFLHQPAEVVPIASAYARATIPGVLPFFGFVVLRQTLQAMSLTRPIVWTILITNGINVVMNYALIFGRFGLPRLEAVGAGWATSVARLLMMTGLLLLGWKNLRPYLKPLRSDIFSPAPLTRMLRLGSPIGIQLELEYGCFGAIALLMGYLGTHQVAAHQIAMNLAALTYMVPLGVSAAAAVRVGQAVGRRDPAGVRGSARAAVVCGGSFMALTALVFWSCPGALSRLYTDDLNVSAISILLIPIAAAFQVFDGLQVVAAGILRGLGDTRVPMIISLIGFWIIGVPASVYLAFGKGAGPPGLWWGFVAGLGSVALFLLIRVREKIRRETARVLMDPEEG